MTLVVNLLVFFGTPILGVGLSRAFARVRTSNRWSLPLVLVLCVGYELLAFNLRFRSLWLELLCVAAAMVAQSAIFWLVGIGPSDEKRAEGPMWWSSFVALPLLPIVAFTPVGRANHAQKLAQPLDGIVLENYRSSNHRARAIVVSRPDGGATTMEGVDANTWNAVHPGVSHLKKPAWSAVGELDGRPVRVVGKAYVMFLGPFRD